MPRDVTLLAPVQQAGSALTVEVANLADKPSVLGFARYAWPALLALGGVGLWVDQPTGRARRPRARFWAGLLLAWAALRCPNGATVFLAVLAAFLLLQVVIPALRRLCATAAPTPAALATAGDPERRRARSDRLVGRRPGVVESGWWVFGAGVLGRFHIRVTFQRRATSSGLGQLVAC